MRWHAGLVAFLAAAFVVPCLGLAGETAAKPDNSLEAAMKRMADSRIDLVVDKKEPDLVLDFIRDAGNVNIIVDPAARRQWEQQTVTMKLKGITVLSAFSQVLGYLNMVATYQDEAFVVTTPDQATPSPQVAVYNIRDMTEPVRDFRLPPELFGSQIDPLYYYWTRTQLGPSTGTGYYRDPFWELDLLNRYPPDPYGEVIAATIQRMADQKELGVQVHYQDGYLVVIHQPKPGRIQATSGALESVTQGTTGQ